MLTQGDVIYERYGIAVREIRLLRAELAAALDAMDRSAEDHNCDYCRADAAQLRERLEQGQPR